MLDVAVGEPFAGPVPLAALQQLEHDVQRRLLVAVQEGIVIDEQGLRIVDADDRLLG